MQTLVHLTWIEERIERWIRFGRIAEERRADPLWTKAARTNLPPPFAASLFAGCRSGASARRPFAIWSMEAGPVVPAASGSNGATTAAWASDAPRRPGSRSTVESGTSGKVQDAGMVNLRSIAAAGEGRATGGTAFCRQGLQTYS